jgi:hypothetical protein
VKTWLTPRNKLALSSAVNQLRRRFSNFANVVAFRLLQLRLAAEGFQAREPIKKGAEMAPLSMNKGRKIGDS